MTQRAVKPGERGRTRMRGRVVIAQEIIGGQVRFVFETDLPHLHFQRRVSMRYWIEKWRVA